MKQTWAKDRADRASKAKRQVRTSAATIGIIFSAGASNLLLTQISNSAPAIAINQPSLSQMPIATRASLTISSIGVPTGIAATVPLAFTQSHTNATQLFEPVAKQPIEKTAKVLQALRVNRLIRQLKASKITVSTAALVSQLDEREAAIARQRWSIDRLRQKLNRLEEESSAELGFEEWQASAGTSSQEQMGASLASDPGLQPAVSLLAFHPQLQTPQSIHGNASGEAMPYVLEAMPEARSMSLAQTHTAASLPKIAVDRPMVLVPLQALSYKVKAGDTLSAIAQQHGLPLTTLITANKLADPNRIQIAQQLIVPLSPSKGSESQQPIIAALENNTNAGMGGNISEDDSVMEANPQGIAEIQRQQSAKAEQAQLSDRYVQNLRSDIEKLQQRYRTQPLLSQAIPTEQPAAKTSGDRLLQKLRQIASIELKTDRNFNSKQASKTLQVEAPKQPQRSVQPTEDESDDSLATAPIGRDATDSLQSIQQRNVSPALPPLDSADTYLPKPTISKKGFMWPARGKLSSGYGYRWGRMHRGIDIAAPVGTPIFAAAAGVVIKSGWNSGGYGNMVDIQHTDGTVTRYAHNKRLLVHKGQTVYQGQQISEMGNTGFSTGPHLHFEIHPLGKKAVNPMAFLPR
ncbi:peptidoglycan DD-metalloendopeptidase family protein [Chroococcidiopsidales cyanobacterium LEGE 13417]|nr:peptidoglycan DD-metalloendopeptidase family protein [Chroococcidiopsidales cyanobacterium LEGE 13417]